MINGGMLTHWSKAGARLGSYLKFSYDLNPDLNIGIRYLYDYKIYRSTDLNENNERASQHRCDSYVTYRINYLFTAAWQTTVYTYQHDFHYKNYKK